MNYSSPRFIARRAAKNSRNICADASAYSGICVTVGFHRWVSVSYTRAFAVIPPPLASDAAKNTRRIRANDIAVAHIAHGSNVT